MASSSAKYSPNCSTVISATNRLSSSSIYNNDGSAGTIIVRLLARNRPGNTSVAVKCQPVKITANFSTLTHTGSAHYNPTMKLIWVLAVAGASGLLVAGCTTSTFTPTTYLHGTLARTDATLPVYLDKPNRPYRVLGMITVQFGRFGNPDQEASQQGVVYGADALLLLNERTRYAGTYNSNFGSLQNYGSLSTYQGSNLSVPLHVNIATYAAIKFKTFSATQQAELDQIDKAIANLESHPDGLTLTNEDGTTSFLPPEVEATGIRFLKAKRAEAINSDD